MMPNSPKNDHKYYWTVHSKYKLIQYGLSANKIKRIIRFPDRKEEGVAPNTIAVMKRKNEKHPQKGEIWVMYQDRLRVKKKEIKDESNENNLENRYKEATGKIKIISAWIYPGETPKDKEIFVPKDVWEELENINSEER